MKSSTTPVTDWAGSSCRRGRHDPIVVLQSVSMRFPARKRYRDYIFRPFRTDYFAALCNVSIKVDAGDCVALLGPNGAGKTTLLKLVSGLLYPSEGSVLVDGRDTVSHNAEARRQVGFVLNEERSFYWRLTGRQNLEFFGALDNLSGSRLRRRISHLLEVVGLAAAGEVRVSDYSSGMRQRLAIARGLLADPAILILDEPTKSLDPIGALEMRSLVSDYLHCNGRRTLIIATHQVDEAEVLCNRVCVLRAGCLSSYASIGEAAACAGGVGGYYRKAVAGGD